MNMTVIAALLMVTTVGVGLLTLFSLRAWPTAAMGLLILAIYTNHYKLAVGPVNVRLEQVAALTLAGLVLLHAVWKGDRLRLTVPGLYAIGWWWALAWSGFLNAPDRGETARNLIRLGLMVLALLVTVNLARTRREWRMLFRFLYIGGVLEASFGILARLLYVWNFGILHIGGMTLHSPINLGVQVTTSLPVPAPYGTLEEGNIFGSTMGALLMASLVLWLHPQSVVSRRWVRAGTVLTALGWILSLTRGAWLSVLLILPLFWIAYPRQKEKRLVHAGILFVMAPLAFLVLAGVILFAPPSIPFVARLRTLVRLSTDPTFNLRLGRWARAFEDIALRPFIGWGPGTFAQLHGITHFAPAWLDSLTIKTFQEGGLFGLVFFYGLWATTVGEGLLGAMRHPEYDERGPVLALALGGAVLFLAYHATDATWLAFMWVWLGMLSVRPEGIWLHDD